eukprot:IDg10302t1
MRAGTAAEAIIRRVSAPTTLRAECTPALPQPPTHTPAFRRTAPDDPKATAFGRTEDGTAEGIHATRKDRLISTAASTGASAHSRALGGSARTPRAAQRLGGGHHLTRAEL